MEAIEKAKRLFREKIDDKILSIVDKSKGANHHVFVIFCEKNNYVLRLPKMKSKKSFKAEAWAFEEWKKLKIPVPKVYSVSKTHILEDFIEGVDLSEVKLSKKTKEKIYYEIGKNLKKMHSVKTTGYGDFVEPGKGKYASWDLYLREDFMKNVDRLFEKGLISSNVKKRFTDYFESRKDCLGYYDPRLLHSDLADNNIIIKKDKLSGFIDASDTISGDPMYDLAIIYYNNHHNFKYVIKGYGVHDMIRIIFYCFYHLVWLMDFHSRKNDRLRCNHDIKMITVIMEDNKLSEKDMKCILDS